MFASNDAWPRLLVVGAFLLSSSTPAMAGQHTWDVNEIFSNPDGTIQFVELVEVNGTPNETNLGANTLSSDTQSFTIGGGLLTPPTSFKHFLIATQAFADLPGAPVPDAIIPLGSIPFASTTGDTVDYGINDSLNYASLPIDGKKSLNRDLSTSQNSPTNYDGVTGSVNASPNIPALSPMGVVVLGGVLIALMGAAIAMRARNGAQGTA